MKKDLLTKLLIIAGLLVIVAAAGCIRSSADREYGGKGEIIHVGAYKPIKLEKVVYALPRHCDETGGDTQPAQVSESDSLIALYASAGGISWKNNDNWLSNAPLGEWRGVTTDDSGSVIEISLPNNDLAGTLPEELGSLSSLALSLIHI